MGLSGARYVFYVLITFDLKLALFWASLAAVVIFIVFLVTCLSFWSDQRPNLSLLDRFPAILGGKDYARKSNAWTPWAASRLSALSHPCPPRRSDPDPLKIQEGAQTVVIPVFWEDLGVGPGGVGMGG